MKSIYIIYDKAAEDISPVFEAKTDTVAIRNFAHSLVRTPYPEDFELHKIAEFEYHDKIGSIIVKPANKRICDGSECLTLISKIQEASEEKVGQMKLFKPEVVE